MMPKAAIPKQQRAVQLVGPDQLRINETKAVLDPGPHQVLGRVEVVGLCFSDLKLLKQFSGHARKSPVTGGITQAQLQEMPNYVPGDQPTVPGHETVVRIVKTGSRVTRHTIGERYLVQTDYRWLPTANSNSAFGYNFEGALQEYVLLDERVITAPDGESMLIPVPEDLPASALALVEPWACVEDAYVEKQRQTLKDGGRTLVVGETPVDKSRAGNLRGKPQAATFTTADKIDGLKNGAYDDVIYFGANPETAEKLFPKIGAGGLFNIVQGGGKFGRAVVSPVGRVHYGGIRVVGTTGFDPAQAMAGIPGTAEIRQNDKINIIGAAGPMGTMHVIRDLVPGRAGRDGVRRRPERRTAGCAAQTGRPLAQKNRSHAEDLQSVEGQAGGQIQLHRAHGAGSGAGRAGRQGRRAGAIINIFAGIPADKTAEIDLDAYIEKQLYFIGTSGSTLDDMKLVLPKSFRASSTPICPSPPCPVWTARLTASGRWKRT
jgi:hypothetical protein